jgi:hypothetical protein
MVEAEAADTSVEAAEDMRRRQARIRARVTRRMGVLDQDRAHRVERRLERRRLLL